MRHAATVTIVLTLVGTAPPPAPQDLCQGVAFHEAARESGLDFVHDRGATGDYHMPETFGSGLAWIDYDGDGWLDLYVVQSGPFPPTGTVEAANRLFRNTGAGGFVEVDSGAGADDRGYGQGVTAADVDGDGDSDLLVTNYGPNALYLNQHGRFERAPLPDAGDEEWSTSVAFADVDGDTDLDAYVVNYLQYDPANAPPCRNWDGTRDYCHPELFAGAADRFLRNRDGERFLEDSTAAGLDPEPGKGLGVMIVDVDGDRAPDIYVANDTTPNFLFANDGEGGFHDRSLTSGTALNQAGLPEAGMGVDAADVDDDRLPDLVVTNFDGETNTLYRNRGNFSFIDDSDRSGFGLPSYLLLGFGIVLDDLNGDRLPDAYIANGHVLERPERDGADYAQPDLLLLGRGDGSFVEVNCSDAVAAPRVSRAAVAADYDNDGDLDIAVSGSGEPLRLLRNDAPARSWLGLVLRGAGHNTDAVGARIRLTTGTGDSTKWTLRGNGYLSSDDPRILFALPEELTGEETVEILWPGGGESRIPLSELEMNRYVSVRAHEWPR